MRRFIENRCVMAASAILIAASSWVCTAAAEAATTPLPERYRDLRAFVTSAPHVGDPGKIRVQVAFHNLGKRDLVMRADLRPESGLRFAGATFEAALQAGSNTAWYFDITPPLGLTRKVLAGSIWLGSGDHEVRARDLFIAIRGPDPAGFDEKEEKTHRIEAAAEAVALHAPATLDAVAIRRRAREEASSNAKHVAIAAAGMSDWEIDLIGLGKAAAKPDAGLKAAIDDFIRCVNLQTGATLNVAEQMTDGPSIRFVLNDCAPSGDEWAHREASHIAITTESITVTAATPAGLKHAVYEILSDDLDCHWFLPRTLGEEISKPANRTASIREGVRELTPSFFSTRGASWGNAPDWDRRNRSVVDGRMVFGHAWGSYINRSQYPYDKFPDYYARDREGKIREMHTAYGQTNFCSTDPTVLDIVAAKVNEQLKSPNALVASLDPEDYAPMCLCDRCLALDRSYGAKNPDGTFVTDRLLHFSKEIHDRLDEANKDKYLGILVYAYQIELPVSARPHPNHAGMICNQPWTFDHSRPFNDPTSPRNRRFFRLVQGWGEILNQLGYYDYYGHWSFWGPWGMVHKMREDLPAFHDHGGTYLMLECQPNFALQGLNHYIAAQLSWNVDADVDVLMDDLFRKFYGPAYVPMRSFWLAAERHYALTRSSADTHRRVGFREGLWEELADYLQQAANAADGGDKRFVDRIAMHQQALEYGRIRFDAEGRWKVRLHRPAQAKREHLTTDDLRELKHWLNENRIALEALQKHFADQRDYLPTLTAGYFFPQFENYFDAIDARLAELDSASSATPTP